MPYPGEVLGGLYRIEDEIGAGGAGIIYRAWHLNLCKYVVVKKIRDHYVGVLNERGEVDILKSLRHTCLPQVYDFLCIGGSVYTVMDFIDGHDLKYYLDQGTWFDTATLFGWMLQLTDVLRYLHAHGILHLDIKPANIMVTTEGNVCLIDFNVSLSGADEDVKGLSVPYASPEQCRRYQAVLAGIPSQAEILDARTDLYSLGASFYHMMTGYPPQAYPGESYPLHRFTLSYPAEFVRIVERAMCYDRRKRWQSADQMYRALEDLTKSKAEKRTLKTVFGGMLAGILVISVICGVLVYRNIHSVERAQQASVDSLEEQNAVLTADALADDGQYVQALEIYEALDLSDPDTLRRMGWLALQAAGTDSAYAAKSVTYYESVREQGCATYTDLLNLDTAYGYCEMDEESLALLGEMLVSYPAKSEVALRLAVVEYNAEMEKSQINRNFVAAREHAQLAKQLYEAGDTDCDITQADELLELMQ